MSDVVLFHFPLTLGVARRAADGRRVTRFTLHATVPDLAAALAARARLGVVAAGSSWSLPALESALRDAGVQHRFDPGLLFRVAAFDAATLAGVVAAAGVPRCLFASPDRVKRAAAEQAGMLAVPHVALLPAVLAGDALVFLRIVARDRAHLADLRPIVAAGLLVPADIAPEDAPTVYATAVSSAEARLAAAGFAVHRIAGADPTSSDLYLMRPGTSEVPAYRRQLQDEKLSWLESDNGFVVCLPATCDAEKLHPPGGGHGHTLELRASRTLLASATTTIAPATTTTAATTAALPAAALAALDQQDLVRIIDAALLQKHLDPCCGNVPLPSGASLTSRHAYHPENGIAATALAAVLETILGPGNVWTEEFDLGNQMLLNVVGEIPGTLSPEEHVVIGAHLDSTAQASQPYTPAQNPAPGADDDASGVAAVLAAAEALAVLAKRQAPKRTLRFVLFNAEEVGMSGSYTHAKNLVDAGAKVVAMLQMDMIGRHPGAGLPYEIHATAPGDFPSVDPAVMQLAGELAAIVSAAGTLVSPALAPQIYPVAGCNTDPAALSSDQRQFILRNIPACLVAENLFADVCGTLVKTLNANPNYHKVTDTIVDCGYAADIARAVAAAAWRIATG